MKKGRLSVQPLQMKALMWFSLLMIATGFYGNMIERDDAPLPDVGWLNLIRAWAVPLILIGSALALVAMIVGTWQINGRIKLGDFMPFLFILPSVAFLVVFVLYPLLNLFYLSLFRGNILQPTKNFLGLANFRQLLSSSEFLIALKNTGIYTVSVVVLLIFISVLLAVWYNKNRRLNTFAQIAVFIPHLIAMVSVAYIWSWIMDPHSYGILGIVGASVVKRRMKR